MYSLKCKKAVKANVEKKIINAGIGCNCWLTLCVTTGTGQTGRFNVEYN